MSNLCTAKALDPKNKNEKNLRLKKRFRGVHPTGRAVLLEGEKAVYIEVMHLLNGT